MVLYKQNTVSEGRLFFVRNKIKVFRKMVVKIALRIQNIAFGCFLRLSECVKTLREYRTFARGNKDIQRFS